MKCPFCARTDNRVVDSRLSRDGDAVRRRRVCNCCGRRFTTFETVEEIPIMIRKKDGRREIYHRDKVRAGILRACEKRNVEMEAVEGILNEVERDFQERAEKEISSADIGETVMTRLLGLDDVAYVRFASVYQAFGDVNDFVEALQKIKEKAERDAARRAAGPSPDDPACRGNPE